MQRRQIEDRKQKTKKLIDNLSESHKDGKSYAEFEGYLKEAFDFLGFQADLIAGSGDTDVLLNANLGEQSYSVCVDGKTSSSGKIDEKQIDWDSLLDHKEKNKADYVLLVGPDFAGGKTQNRAETKKICLLKTEDLVKILEQHLQYPFNLMELKDLFSNYGMISSQVEDSLEQCRRRQSLVEQIPIVLKQMKAVQEGKVNFFTVNTLLVGPLVAELDVEREDIENIVHLFNLPFFRGIQELTNNHNNDKYILATNIRDLAFTFQETGQILLDIYAQEDEGLETRTPERQKDLVDQEEKRELGTSYVEWEDTGQSWVGIGKKSENRHYCPQKHAQTVARKVLEAFEKKNIVTYGFVHDLLMGENLAPNRPYRGKSESHKIRVIMGILEHEGFLKWTGSKSPVKFKLKTDLKEVKSWLEDKLFEK